MLTSSSQQLRWLEKKASYTSFSLPIKHMQKCAKNQSLKTLLEIWAMHIQRDVNLPDPILLYLIWTPSFWPSFNVIRENSAKIPLPLCAWKQDDHAWSDLQWHGMITAFSINVRTRCSAPLQARSLSNTHRVFHIVIHNPAQEV